ncbi:hypothetical protein GCM10009798_20340 [Nocardioides panacihumi]|uniref:Uncharacterized protein n=1 Tax=Nocardioides panacihumi TaxID=400774 RepID=A0ABN2QYW9_9ACTN
MYEPPSDTGREPPGQVPGLVVGVAAGLLLSTVWAFGAWDVALALTTVFAGLVLAIGLGAPAWRRFGLALLVGAALVAAAFVLVAT